MAVSWTVGRPIYWHEHIETVQIIHFLNLNAWVLGFTYVSNFCTFCSLFFNHIPIF